MSSHDPQSDARPFLGVHMKQQCEDFIVEELPAYEPSGEGDHLYLWVEKRDAAAKYALRELSRGLNVAERDIGSAGNKDRRAITRQYYSVPAHDVDREALGELPWAIGDQLTVLEATLHGNKLRRGHLRGNRFEVVVQLVGHTQGSATAIAEEIAARIEHIRATGLKNFYGAQRFGKNGETVSLGLALLRRDPDVSRRLQRDRFLKRLALNAVQSELFNEVLRRRLARDGGTWRVMRGDVLERVESGGSFVCEDEVVDQARLDRGELVITGPMYGPKMMQPGDPAQRLEQEVLDEYKLDLRAFGAFAKLCAGARRACQVSVADLEAEVYAEHHVRLRFSLPSGCYATVLLAQIFDEVKM